MQPTTSCARCGTVLDATAAFCSACGSARTQSPMTSGARRLLRSDPVLEALRATTTAEFDIGGRLGAGGMAAVYLAHELRLNRRVAIKAMLPELLDNDDMIERFFDEARKQARLEHANILPIYSLQWNVEVPFFVMKFVDGFSVEDILQARGGLPVPVAQHVLAGTIAGLQYAHDEGVIHRDVKPANVLVDRRGQPVVSDFGIAKAAESPNLTQTGAAIGTPTYMSPEQCRGLQLTPASDQYSVGVLAFHLLTGSTPFTGSLLDLLQAHAEDPPPSLVDRCPDCPPQLAAAIMRMLEKEPEDRWPDLRDALPDLTAGMGSEADARRQLVALFPDRPTAAESLPLTPKSPTPASSKTRKKSAPVISLVVAPASGNWELSVGETVRMTVRRTGDTGAGQSTASVAWETSDDAVASVSAEGHVTAHASGPVSIIASDGPLTGRCELTVVGAGEKPRNATTPLHVPSVAEQLTADPATEIVPRQRAQSASPPVQPPTEARGRRRAGAIAAIGLAAVAAISLYVTRNRGASTPAPAAATAAMPDSAAVAAETAAVAATAAAPTAAVPAATIPTAAPTAARVSLLVTRTALRVGDSARATARAFDAAGKRMSGAPITLTSSAPSVVKIDADGLLLAIATGTTTINARSGPAGTSESITVEERLMPLSVSDASETLRPLLVSASDERWEELQHVVHRDVLEAMRSKRRLGVSLTGEPHVLHNSLDSATVDFDVTMKWLNFARLGRSGDAPLRATFVRVGQGWRITEIIARGQLP